MKSHWLQNWLRTDGPADNPSHSDEWTHLKILRNYHPHKAGCKMKKFFRRKRDKGEDSKAIHK